MVSDHLQARSRSKPWTIDKDWIRNERIDKLATKILIDEALKIIMESYKAVFKANKEDKIMEEEV